MNTTKSYAFSLTDLLPKLATCEDQGQQEELTQLARADAAASPLLLGGVLISADSTEARMCETVEQLAGAELPDLENELSIRLHDDLFAAIGERTCWAYRVGLVVGLRLAAALRPPRDPLAVTVADVLEKAG